MTKCLHQIRFLLPFNSKVLFYFKNRIKNKVFLLMAVQVFSVLAESRGRFSSWCAGFSPHWFP